MRLYAWMIMLLNIIMSSVACPHECKCGLDDQGRRYIYCNQGDMYEIPIEQMNRDAEVIIISPPDDRPNILTIGPIFTRPRPFTRLEELHITNSFVPSIGQYSLWGLPEMRVLNLVRNNISHITTDNFRGLLNLTHLHLDRNIIGQMPSETFRYLIELRVLTMSHNRITSLVPRLFRMLAKLRELDLSYNPLDELNPEAFKDIQDIRTLRCRRCGLRRVNTQIYHFIPYLEILDLRDNNFKYLTSDEFISLKRLKVLHLDGNQLPVIVDDLFGKQQNLHTLTISRNRLALITQRALTNLTRLRNLDISYNKLDKFHLQTFGPVMESLRHLNFSGNNLPLNEIALVLQIFPEIHGVGMANLSLKYIPPNFFSYNAHITDLDLSWNQFNKFPLEILSKVKFLQNFDISKNKLQGLDETALLRLESIGHINISNNPWNCELCDIALMLHYMKTTVLNGTIRKQECFTPKKIKGTKLGELEKVDVDWCSSNSIHNYGSGIFIDESSLSIFAGVLLLIFLAGSAVTAGICYSKRRTAEYYTNEEKRQQATEKMFDSNQLVYFCESEENSNHKFSTSVMLPDKSRDRMIDGGSVATIHAPYQIVSRGS